MELIIEKLQEESKVRGIIMTKNIVAARKVNRVLSLKQLTKWREIQASARARSQ